MKHAVVIPRTRERSHELIGCGEVRGDNIVVDRESDCYRAWKRRQLPPNLDRILTARERTNPPCTPDDDRGPGSVVRSILARMGYETTPDGLRCGANGKFVSRCGCRGFQRKMNEWGWSGCIVHLPEIIRWFSGKAKLCGVELDAAMVKSAIVAAWDEARGKS